MMATHSFGWQLMLGSVPCFEDGATERLGCQGRHLVAAPLPARWGLGMASSSAR
jgi:hypothetical protein